MKGKTENVASIEVNGSHIKKDEYDYSSKYGIKVKADSLITNICTSENVYEVNTHIKRM